MSKVIYFNQWFSSITDVIKDIKHKHNEGVYIIGSSRNKDHAYKDVVDKFIVEDWEEVADNTEESKQNYINWVFNTCKTNNIDIFFVKKHSDWIAEHKYDFYKLGVFLICEDIDIINKLDSKAGTYDILSKDTSLSRYIPNYLKTSDKDEIYKTLMNVNKDNPWCFKLDSDEGGASFRNIDTEQVSLSTLSAFRTNTVSIQEAKDMLLYTSPDDLNKLIYMELLDSPEISVDCYDSRKGFIAICREKIAKTRVQRIYYNRDISNICEKIKDTFGFKFPFNVQFRVAHGKDSNKTENLRLLEINPRLSGGTYYSTMFNMNLAHVCLCDYIGYGALYDIKDFIDFSDKKVTHVEKAIILED